MRKIQFTVILFTLALLLIGCSNYNKPIFKTSFLFNTVVEIKIFSGGSNEVLEEAFALCRRLESIFSKTIEESEISKLNRGMTGWLEPSLPGGKENNMNFIISPETLELLKLAKQYSAETQGAFDLTIAPVTSLWDFTGSSKEIPDIDKINAATLLVDYTKLNLTDHCAYLEESGMSIDLGGIAKGYMADKVKEFLISNGVTSAFLNFGGNILCIGEKPDGSAFNIGIEKPFDINTSIAVMEIRDYSVVTSGIYQRFFYSEETGKRYHHLLDPSTGFPYENDLLSVTIFSKISADGDALSTSCFALGLEKGLDFISKKADTCAVFITSDYNLHYSENFFIPIVSSETDTQNPF